LIANLAVRTNAIGAQRGPFVAAMSANAWLIEALGHHHAMDMYAVNPQRSVVSAAAQIGGSATRAASNSSLMMISYG
jgi:hypothetical protein